MKRLYIPAVLAAALLALAAWHIRQKSGPTRWTGSGRAKR